MAAKGYIVEKFEAENIEITIWKNPKNIKAELEKKFRDTRTGDWKTATTYLDRWEVDRLCRVARAARKWFKEHAKKQGKKV